MSLPLLLWACLHGGVARAERRVAVVIGNDHGQPSEEPLRYAELDAARFARVLRDLGDVR